MTDARLLALEALLRVENDDAYSNIILNSVLSKKSNMSKRDEALCTALFYGVLEKKITLEYIVSNYSKIPIKRISKDVLYVLLLGVYQIKFMDKIPNSAAINESVNLAKKIKKFSATGFINGVLRSFVRNNCEDFLEKLKGDKIKYFSAKYSCSETIITTLIQSYGEDYAEEFLCALQNRSPLNIRVNTLKIDKENLKELLKKENIRCEDIGICENALKISNTGALEGLRTFREGLFHIQNLASQICLKILNPQKGQTLVDVCAAPGGKSFTAAEMMQNAGRVFSFDLYEHKIDLIKNGAKRLGINIIRSEVRDASVEIEAEPFADLVSCDVPCSGIGAMFHKPEIRYKNGDSFKNLPDLQYKILCNSDKMLKKGGKILYSTCTLNKAENNDVADKFLAEHKNYEALKIDINGLKRNNFEKENQLTLFPQIHNTDGFFMALFKKME